jgi:uncharacterized protein
MKCQSCTAAATLHLTEALTRGRFTEAHLCEKCLQSRGDLGGPVPEILRGEAPDRRDGGARFVVARLVLSEVSDQQVVVLQEAGGTRQLPLVTGFFEATSLDRRLKQLPSPRPLTHDGWLNTITALRGEVQDVFLADLRDHTYYASLRIRQRLPDSPGSEAVRVAPVPPPLPASRLIEVDLRPSDAFILAVELGAPIFIKDAVLDEVLGPPETGIQGPRFP